MALGGQLVDVTTKAAIVQRSTLEDEDGKGALYIVNMLVHPSIHASQRISPHKHTTRTGKLVVTASLCASVGSTVRY